MSSRLFHFHVRIKSLDPGSYDSNIKSIIFKPTVETSSWGTLWVKLLQGECHRTWRMRSQHWFRQWLDASSTLLFSKKHAFMEIIICPCELLGPTHTSKQGTTAFVERSARTAQFTHDDVIKEKHFPRYWPFVRGIPQKMGHCRFCQGTPTEILKYADHRPRPWWRWLPLQPPCGSLQCKRFSKQSWRWWFDTPSCPSWRRCNATMLSCCHMHNKYTFIQTIISQMDI